MLSWGVGWMNQRELCILMIDQCVQMCGHTNLGGTWRLPLSLAGCLGESFRNIVQLWPNDFKNFKVLWESFWKANPIVLLITPHLTDRHLTDRFKCPIYIRYNRHLTDTLNFSFSSRLSVKCLKTHVFSDIWLILCLVGYQQVSCKLLNGFWQIRC